MSTLGAEVADFEVDDNDNNAHAYSRFDSSPKGEGVGSGWGKQDDGWNRGDDLPNRRAPSNKSSQQPSNNNSSIRHGDETTDNSNNCTLFIARFDSNTEEGEFRDLFSKYGTIVDVSIKAVIANPQNKIAYVSFEEPQSASEAKACLHKSAALGSASIIVDYKMSKLRDNSKQNPSYDRTFDSRRDGSPPHQRNRDPRDYPPREYSRPSYDNDDRLAPAYDSRDSRGPLSEHGSRVKIAPSISSLRTSRAPQLPMRRDEYDDRFDDYPPRRDYQQPPPARRYVDDRSDPRPAPRDDRDYPPQHAYKGPAPSRAFDDRRAPALFEAAPYQQERGRPAPVRYAPALGARETGYPSRDDQRPPADRPPAVKRGRDEAYMYEEPYNRAPPSRTGPPPSSRGGGGGRGAFY